MVTKAVVITSPIHLEILETRTSARNSQKAQSFDDITSAIKWLKSQG